MKTNKNLSIVAVVMLILAVISFAFKKGETNFNLGETIRPLPLEEETPSTTSISIRIKVGEKTEILDLEEYVVGVVAGEMPASFELEALKAQAVASRSYALYRKNKSTGLYDLSNDTNTQVYLGDEDMKAKWGAQYQMYRDKIESAVNSTRGEVLSYQGDVIEAFYFAMSSGTTNESAMVFGEKRDYLQSVESVYDTEQLNGFSKEVYFSKGDFKSKLGLSCDDIVVDAIERSSSNYIDEIGICSKTFKGIQIRSLLGLRSTDFDIEVLDDVKIVTRGYGHGVGMSQYGANGYAKAGYTYEDILHHYYTDVELTNIKDV